MIMSCVPSSFPGPCAGPSAAALGSPPHRHLHRHHHLLRRCGVTPATVVAAAAAAAAVSLCPLPAAGRIIFSGLEKLSEGRERERVTPEREGRDVRIPPTPHLRRWG